MLRLTGPVRYLRYERVNQDGVLEMTEIELSPQGYAGWKSEGTSGRATATPSFEIRRARPGDVQEAYETLAETLVSLGYALVESVEGAEPTAPKGKVAKGPYVKRFQAMVKALRAHRAIEIQGFDLNPPASPAAIAKVKKAWGLDDGTLAFWAQADGLQLRWTAKEQEGGIELLPLQRVFGDWKGTVWFDWMPEDAPARRIHPVDFPGSESCAAFALDGAEHPIMLLHVLGERTDSLAVDFPTYLELLLKTRGFHEWQTVLVDALAPEGYGTTSPAAVRKMLPELFPDVAVGDLVANQRPTSTRRKKPRA